MSHGEVQSEAANIRQMRTKYRALRHVAEGRHCRARYESDVREESRAFWEKEMAFYSDQIAVYNLIIEHLDALFEALQDLLPKMS